MVGKDPFRDFGSIKTFVADSLSWKFGGSTFWIFSSGRLSRPRIRVGRCNTLSLGVTDGKNTGEKTLGGEAHRHGQEFRRAFGGLGVQVAPGDCDTRMVQRGAHQMNYVSRSIRMRSEAVLKVRTVKPERIGLPWGRSRQGA